MPGARSPIRRPPARCRCSIRTANAPLRCTTPPMWPRASTPAAARSPSRSTAARAQPRSISISASPARASSTSAPNGRTARRHKLIDNPDTWLAFTDLVMIDPIGTGWSRTAKADGGSAYWGVRSDASVLAKVIALYVARSSRSASPKYLLGESYGGFRAAKVAGTLKSEQGIVVSGIVMVSPLLEAALQWSGSQYALGAALHFPSLVATELDRTKKFTPEALAEAERFALTDYLTGLAGPPPTGDRAKALYGRIAQLTGLPVDVGDQIPRLGPQRLSQSSARKGLTVSFYDARICHPRSVSRERAPARRRPDARRLQPRAVRRLCRLCPRRARLQDRHDLQSSGARRVVEVGMGRRPQPARRERRPARTAGAGALVPAAGRARPHRSRDALRRQPLCARPHSGYRRLRPRRSSSSIAAATCSISIRIRAARFPTKPGRSIRPSPDPASNWRPAH